MQIFTSVFIVQWSDGGVLFFVAMLRELLHNNTAQIFFISVARMSV